jgi:fatty acid-binding protein DegV
MPSYVLTCCSTADLSKEYFAQRNIPYVCFHFTMDGVEYADDLGQSMPFDEFYARIAAGAMPTTSLVNTAQFIAFFEPLLKEGKDILHLSFSSGLSGTYASALLAQDAHILFDSRRIPDTIFDVLAVNQGWLEAHRKAIAHLIAVHFRGLHALQRNPGDTAFRLARHLGLPGQAVMGLYRGLSLPGIDANRSYLDPRD